MDLVDPRAKPAFQVRVLGGDPGLRLALTEELLDVRATDDDLAKIVVTDAEAPPPNAESPDALVWIVAAAPSDDDRARLTELKTVARQLYVCAPPSKTKPKKSRKKAKDDEPPPEDATLHAWAELVDPAHVYLIDVPEDGRPHGVEQLRAALLLQALEGVDASVERTRIAKRPYATSIIAGAALMSAAEGLLPGAAALVLTTQIGAITSLYYLYTGRWLGRTQVFALIPVFASEAAGGSAFLLVKSFLPPTGVADVVAAGIASSMTIAMLGAVTWALERGYDLNEEQQLRLAFQRLNAKTRAERAEIARNRGRWGDKQFWNDTVRRLIFE
jgi:hypothetical protein